MKFDLYYLLRRYFVQKKEKKLSKIYEPLLQNEEYKKAHAFIANRAIEKNKILLEVRTLMKEMIHERDKKLNES